MSNKKAKRKKQKDIVKNEEPLFNEMKLKQDTKKNVENREKQQQ